MTEVQEVEIRPAGRPIDAVVRLPGSKSYTNRALLVAALANGRSTIRGALFSDDTHYMSAALRELGIPIAADPAACTFAVDGRGGQIPAGRADLFAGNAGTAGRFLTALLALGHGRYTLDGTARMRERPIQPLLDGLTQLGARAYSQLGNGCPPVTVEADGLPGGRAHIPGDQSSQYFSALLLVGAYAERGIELVVEGELVSRPYVDLTAAIMRSFGVEMVNQNYRRLVVAGGGRYQAREYDVEPDASAASYFFAAAALTGGRVRVEALGYGSAQGDVRFVDVLEQLGCRVTRGADFVEVVGPAELGSVEVDMGEISDTFLTLAAIAPFARGPVAIRGIGHTRLQETDRVAAVAAELRRLGVRVDEHPDGLRIHPSPVRPASIATYGDHRVAMSFALVGLRVPGIRIQDPACVNKTFPDFFTRLAQLT